jgi:hypothetical protein
MELSTEDDPYTANNLFTNESWFTRAEITNIHNEHMRTDENPHDI